VALGDQWHGRPDGSHGVFEDRRCLEPVKMHPRNWKTYLKYLETSWNE
jgi:hypothetical protein